MLCWYWENRARKISLCNMYGAVNNLHIHTSGNTHFIRLQRWNHWTFLWTHCVCAIKRVECCINHYTSLFDFCNIWRWTLLCLKWYPSALLKVLLRCIVPVPACCTVSFGLLQFVLFQINIVSKPYCSKSTESYVITPLGHEQCSMKLKHVICFNDLISITRSGP